MKFDKLQKLKNNIKSKFSKQNDKDLDNKNKQKERFSFSLPVNRVSLRLYGSKKGIEIERKRLKNAGKWIIHPFSSFRFIWDCASLFMLLLNLIFIPFGIAFYKGEELFWLIFKQFSDFWFLLDIILNFRTGVLLEGPDSEVILDPKKIRTIYLQTWFFVDFISSFPIDIIFNIFFQESDFRDHTFSSKTQISFQAFQLFRFTKLIALLRVLRLSRFIRYVKQWQEIILNYQYDAIVGIFRVTNLIVVLLYICHFNGCLQYMVPMFFDFPEDTWVRIRGLNQNNVTIWERYSWSIFRSTSQMLCIGYGRLIPHGLLDLWVTFFCMVSGALSFAMFIGHATSLIQSMDTSKRAYKEKYIQVKEYMAFRKLPRPLRSRISDYYESRFQGKMFDEEKILRELNHVLREEVIQFTCKDLVGQIPFFYHAPASFMNAILAKLDFEVFLNGDNIIEEGSYGTKIYFISRGTVRVYCKRRGLEQILQDGCYFGETVLTKKNKVNTATVTAVSCCFMFSLSLRNFEEVMEEFPDQNRRLRNLRDSSSDSGAFTTKQSSSILSSPQKFHD